MRDATRSFVWVGPLLCGVLLAACFPPLDWHKLGWVALVPLAWSWQQPQWQRSTWLAAYVGGVLIHLSAINWMRTCYLYEADWFGPFTIGWLTIGLMGGWFFLVFCWYGRRLHHLCRLPMTIVLPVVWLSFELVRHHGGALFDQTGFHWGKLAITHAEASPLVQVADLGGEYLLSALIALANGAIVDAYRCLRIADVRERLSYAIAPAFGAWLLVMAYSYGVWRTQQVSFDEGPVICLMGELDLPPFLHRGRIEDAIAKWQRDNPREALDHQQPDLYVWSELALHHKLIEMDPASDGEATRELAELPMMAARDLAPYRRYVHSSLHRTARELNATLLLGCERYELRGAEWRRFNSLACIDPGEGLQGWYDKRYLVPWSEFRPYEALTAGAASSGFYRHGATDSRFHLDCRDGRHVLQTALCYDILFADHFRPGKIARDQGERASFFVHCGAEGQDRSDVLADLMLRSARLRAIETRRAMVRHIDFGDSAMIDGNGRILRSLPRQPLDVPTVLGSIPIDSRWSGYTTWGDWPAVALCSFFGMIAMRPRRPEG